MARAIKNKFASRGFQSPEHTVAKLRRIASAIEENCKDSKGVWVRAKVDLTYASDTGELEYLDADVRTEAAERS